jgi:hypothetical protein
MNWNTDNGNVSREVAISKIKEMAREEGIKGAFKVFYQGNLVVSPESLPATVNMSDINVSAVLDNASC